MLIWTNFDSFTITYLRCSLHQKFQFLIETVLDFLQTQKGLELVFLRNFPFIIRQNLAKFH